MIERVFHLIMIRNTILIRKFKCGLLVERSWKSHKWTGTSQATKYSSITVNLINLQSLNIYKNHGEWMDTKKFFRVFIRHSKEKSSWLPLLSNEWWQLLAKVKAGDCYSQTTIYLVPRHLPAIIVFLNASFSCTAMIECYIYQTILPSSNWNPVMEVWLGFCCDSTVGGPGNLASNCICLTTCQLDR